MNISKLIFLLIASLGVFTFPPAFAQLGTLNCGIKPIPKIGYKIGRCVNGQWEQVSSNRASGTLNCGIKPIPKIGYKIGRCVNGKWEQISK